MWKNAVKSDRP